MNGISKELDASHMAYDTLRLAKAGDADAFSELVRAQEQSLYRVCTGMLRNREDALDACQETVFTAWRKLGSLREDRYFKSWLIRIAINECKKILAKRPELAAVPVESAGSEDERLFIVRDTFSLLDPKKRAVAVLYYFEDMGIPRIAELLKLPQGTVKSRLFAARQQLKKWLRED